MRSERAKQRVEQTSAILQGIEPRTGMVRGKAHEAKARVAVMKKKKLRNLNKGAWGMPRLSEAKKDVTSCEKPERGANTLRPQDIRMGQPVGSDPDITQEREANAGN